MDFLPRAVVSVVYPCKYRTLTTLKGTSSPDLPFEMFNLKKILGLQEVIKCLLLKLDFAFCTSYRSGLENNKENNAVQRSL